jgi:ATP-dependent DNA ligase
MRPKAVTVVPQEDGLPGGVLYEIKLDGFRCVAFAHGNRPAYLQSRSGRDLAPEFPVIADAVNALPAGLVLDSELCAWRSGKFAFEELLRSPRARSSDPEVALALVVFDILALPGRDVRALPLAQRRELLQDAVAGIAPPIQMVMATTDRSQAMDWYEHLAPTGVEGLVCKALSSRYRPRGARTAWVKIPRTDTSDATVTAITGTPRRPRALVVELDDGTRTLTSPQLDTVQARNLAQAMADRLGEPVEDPDHGTIHPLRTRLRAELQLRTDRHPAARYVRLRGD